MNMNFDQISNTEGRSFEDQDGADYIRDDGGFAIYCSGHYTLAELKAKVAQLEEANTHFHADTDRLETFRAEVTAQVVAAVDHAKRDEEPDANLAEYLAGLVTECEIATSVNRLDTLRLHLAEMTAR